MKFRRDNLVTICKKQMENESANICDMIEIDDNDKPKIRSNSKKQLVTDVDLVVIFPHVFVVMKNLFWRQPRDL